MPIPGLEFKHIISFANGDYNFGSTQTGNRLSHSSNGGTEISPNVEDDSNAFELLGVPKLHTLCFA